MRKAENTSTCPTLDSISSAIDLMPGAVLLIDREGRVQKFNKVAGRLLRINAKGSRFPQLAKQQETIERLLQSAWRCTCQLPIAFNLANGDERFCGTVRSVPGARPGAPAALLLACHEQGSAMHRMRMLNQRLEQALLKQKVLRRQNRSLQQTIDITLPKLREQSIRDPLTSIYNRRYFDRQLAREWQRALRQQSTISLIYLDVDHFKRFNDALGHLEGDHCLRAVADALQRSVSRQFDVACRIGGEEFALILPMTPREGAERVARRVLQLIWDLEIHHPRNVADVVTASIGVGAAIPHQGGRPEQFIDAVDRAMFEAKSQGRNRICCAGSEWAKTAESRHHAVMENAPNDAVHAQ
ncbi:MAG: diguanylate cyclase [Woeseia sp.]